MRMKITAAAVAVLALLCLASPARSQNLTTISADNIQDVSGRNLAAGQLCFQATDEQNRVLSFRAGGGGQVITTPFCTPVVNGAVTNFSVPNPDETAPINIKYRVTVTPRPARPGAANNLLTYNNVYLCDIVGACDAPYTFDLDLYIPRETPIPYTAIPSPGPAGPTGPTGPAGPAGAGVGETASVVYRDTTGGNDSDDGLTLGKAKLTISSAITACPTNCVIHNTGNETLASDVFTAVTTKNIQITLESGTLTFGTAATYAIPINIAWDVKNGAGMAASNGVTVTINGAFDAGSYRVFTLTGTGLINPALPTDGKFNVMWWGANGQIATDQTIPIQQAINAAQAFAACCGRSGTVWFPRGGWLVTSSLSLGEHPVSLESVAPDGNATVLRGNFADAVIKKTAGTSDYVSIRRMNIENFHASGECINLSYVDNAVIEENFLQCYRGMTFGLETYAATISKNQITCSSYAAGSWGMHLNGHKMAINNDITGCGEGARISSITNSIFGGRFEVNGIAIRSGINSSGGGENCRGCYIGGGVSFEANDVDLEMTGHIGGQIGPLSSMGSENAPSGQSIMGIHVISAADVTFSGISMFGGFSGGACVFDSGDSGRLVFMAMRCETNFGGPAIPSWSIGTFTGGYSSSYTQTNAPTEQWSVGEAGVSLADDGDGAVTTCGKGNGTDECLTWNYDDTSNVVSVSTSTGVTTIDFGAITLTHAGGGGGSGTVTSVGLVGTANQLTVTGASPITASGSWTISIPTNPTLPGTTTGTFSGNLTGNVTGNTSGTAATITGALALANTPLTTTGDLLYATGGALARLARGTDTQCLTASATTILWATCGAGGGMTNPMTTTGDTIYASDTAAPSTPARLAIGVDGDYSTVVSGLPAWRTPGIVPNAQTGASYTWLTGDRGKIVWQSNGGATAYTLPQAGSTGFASNWFSGLFNTGAGLVTITPTTSTINGGATAIVPQNWYGPLHSDPTGSGTYRMPIVPTIGAFPNCVDTGGNHINFTSATGAFSCGTSGGAAGARFTAGGDAIVDSDIALGAGWGSTATKSAITGHDQAFNFTITAGGTGIAANPTFTMTFTDGTWTLSPIFACYQTGGNDVLSDITFTNGVTTATTIPGIWNGTPTTGKTYIITCLGVGR